MPITWQKAYKCVNPQGCSHSGVTARLLGYETFDDITTGTGADWPHGNWGPAQRTCPYPYTYTYLKFGSCRVPPPAATPSLPPNDSVTVHWSVHDGSCQLSALLWENLNVVSANPVSQGTLPGGGVAFYDEEMKRLTIAVTNDQEAPPEGSPGIDLGPAKVAHAKHALNSQQMVTLLRRFAVETGPQGEFGFLEWEPLLSAAYLHPAEPVLVPGHGFDDFVTWDEVRVSKHLRVGEYTAFYLDDVDLGEALLMGGLLSQADGSPLLDWCEQISPEREHG